VTAFADQAYLRTRLAILNAKAPDVPERLAKQLALAMERLRNMDLFKPPGVAETLDWGAALTVLGRQELDPTTVDETLGVVLKYQEDVDSVRSTGVATLLA